MKYKNLLFILFLCLSVNTFAQNNARPWAIGGAYSAIDFKTPIGKWFDGWNPGLKILVNRSLNSSFNLATSFSLNPVSRNGVLTDGFEENIKQSSLFLDLDLGIQYKFANGYILKENSWFEPYIHAGVGLSVIEKTRGLFNVGVGFNFWLPQRGDDNLGFFVQTDYDYLPTFNDYLHHSVGIKIRFGAKDSDGDGIVDSKDRCPNQKGTASLMGCPDSDGDGIADKDDGCPQIAGLKNMNGCPDSDGDGIADKDDNCPQVAGLKNMNGCPDSDGDGVADKDDNCPKVAGLKSLNGCPDSDGDGITDKDDNCPQVAGLRSLNGCPDSDGDGIADKDDKCPKVAGVKRLNGCPEKKVKKVNEVEIEKKLSLSASHIQFNTGSTVIKRNSYPDLDKVLALMKANPTRNFKIEGHTDNVGNPVRNRALSQQRANAVKAYFIKRNIRASRISAKGYGDSKPVTSNSTPQGRRKNRRVEIHLAE